MKTAEPSLREQRRTGALIVLWSFLCLLAFLYHLGEIPPYHSDENYYVQSVKNMLDSGDYITPVFDGKKRFNKPILFYWLMAASTHVLGFGVVAARFSSIVFGALGVWLVYHLARRLFDPETAVLSSLILPGLYLYFDTTRFARPDSVLSFFVLASIYFFVRGYQEEAHRVRNIYLFHLAMALGFLTKGPVAILLPMLTVVIFLLVLRDWRMMKQLRVIHGLLIILAVNLPWFLIMYALHSDEFLNHLLKVEIENRIFREESWSLKYFLWIIQFFLPWSLFLVPAIAVNTGLARWPSRHPGGETSSRTPLFETVKKQFRGLTEEENRPLLLCLIWFSSLILFFTLMRSARNWYLLPICPAYAMILAHFLTRIMNVPGWLEHRLFKIPFQLTLMYYGGIALLAVAGILLFRLIFPVTTVMYALPLLALAGAGLLYFLYVRRNERWMLPSLALVQMLILTLIIGEALPYFSKNPMKTAAQEILKMDSGESEIILYRLGNNRARLGVLTGRQVWDLNRPEELRRFLGGENRVFVVVRERVWKEELQQAPLTRVTTILTKIKKRFDLEVLKSIWDKGIRESVPDYTENLLLMTHPAPAG